MNHPNEFAERYERLVSGDPFTVADGTRFRILPGDKKPGDLVLELHADGRWRRVTFETVGVMVEFLYRNEDLLYPPKRDGGNNLGGEKVFRFLRECIRSGHPDAWRNLEMEKRLKRERQLNQPSLFGDAA